MKNKKIDPADLDNTDVGYKDMLVNVKMYRDLEGKDFHIAELQVHLASMIEAKSNKEKGGHLMYRIIRKQQEVIDGQGTKSRFGAAYKNFDTDKDWEQLKVIKEIRERPMRPRSRRFSQTLLSLRSPQNSRSRGAGPGCPCAPQGSRCVPRGVEFCVQQPRG